jgi:hypothetical protein
VRTYHPFVLVAAALSVALLAPAGPSAAAARPSPVGGYFSVQPDLRLCPAPVCGGVFVSLLNKRLTTCPDGARRESCHASVVDWSRLALRPAAIAELEDAVLAGRGLVRGQLRAAGVGDENGPLVVLTVTEGWVAATGRRPGGSFFQIADNGIVCVTSPCFSLHEGLLNAKAQRALSGLDLAASGAAEKVIQAALGDVYAGSILVAGRNRTVPNAGPAGDGVELVATQFYLRVRRSGPPR